MVARYSLQSTVKGETDPVTLIIHRTADTNEQLELLLAVEGAKTLKLVPGRDLDGARSVSRGRTPLPAQAFRANARCRFSWRTCTFTSLGRTQQKRKSTSMRLSVSCGAQTQNLRTRTGARLPGCESPGVRFGHHG